MVRIEFTDLIKRLCSYYERPNPKDSTADLWYGELQMIPGEAIEWIFGEVKKRFETLPKNLPRAIKDLWSEWLTAHPDKLAHGPKKGCPQCHEGHLDLSRYVTEFGAWYDVRVRCKCQGGKYSRRELQDRGYWGPICKVPQFAERYFDPPFCRWPQERKVGRLEVDRMLPVEAMKDEKRRTGTDDLPF